MRLLKEIVERIFLTAGVREPKSFRCRDNSDFLLVRIFHHLENQQNFPNRFTVLNRHLLLKKLKESFSGNSVKILDRRAFS